MTANPDEGYEFVGWEGSDATETELTISINSNITLNAIFREIITQETSSIDSYYYSGDILSLEPIIFYDRSLTVNGIKIIVAGEIGGQQAVPDKWVYKTAQVFKLLTDKNAEDINIDASGFYVNPIRNVPDMSYQLFYDVSRNEIVYAEGGGGGGFDATATPIIIGNNINITSGPFLYSFPGPYTQKQTISVSFQF